MTNQSNEAAERSAHVTRGSAHTTSDSVMLEVSPGVFKLRVLAEAEQEIERLRAEVASLRLTLGGRTFSGDTIPDPIGCRAPGACAQVAEIQRLHGLIDLLHGNAVKAAEINHQRTILQEHDITRQKIENGKLRAALEKIAHSADYGSIISPDGDMHEEAIQTALDALVSRQMDIG